LRSWTFLAGIKRIGLEYWNNLGALRCERDEDVVRRHLGPVRLLVVRLGDDDHLIAVLAEIKRIGRVILREAKSEQVFPVR
jgi:hypothetical protein